MNSKALRWMVSVVAVVILAVGICARAQAPTPTHFSGLINDYSPETIMGKVVGPWEMHGKWSLDLKGRSGLADFSAENDHGAIGSRDGGRDCQRPRCRHRSSVV